MSSRGCRNIFAWKYILIYWIEGENCLRCVCGAVFNIEWVLGGIFPMMDLNGWRNKLSGDLVTNQPTSRHCMVWLNLWQVATFNVKIPPKYKSRSGLIFFYLFSSVYLRAFLYLIYLIKCIQSQYMRFSSEMRSYRIYQINKGAEKIKKSHTLLKIAPCINMWPRVCHWWIYLITKCWQLLMTFEVSARLHFETNFGLKKDDKSNLQTKWHFKHVPVVIFRISFNPWWFPNWKRCYCIQRDNQC